MLIAKVIDYDSGRTYTGHGEKYDLLNFFHTYFPETREMDRVEECVEALNQDGYYKAEVKPANPPSNLWVKNHPSDGPADDPWVREADLEEDGNL